MKAIRILGVIALVMTLVLGGCTQNQADDDAKFLDWMREDIDYQSRTNDKLVNEMNSYEWYKLEVAADEAEDYLKTVRIPEFDSFNVSGECVALRDEYREYLSDVSLYFCYMKSFGKEMLYGQLDEASDALDNANDYVGRATAHMRRVNELLASL